ncbi:uncharacterized protein LOC107045071 [Diachasma alloeum]|uniref:uncharacterized protein LOC107045071 n=1 Tax=Diachasma alloeum TaxID=454923 RepID=UPI0007381B34|nr:uncharacterized protein LOC107045071 [Diachasma alloeum]
MWVIFLIGLLTQGLATQVSYGSKSSSVSSSEPKTQWSWQEPTAEASNDDASFHPLSFSAGNANIQSGSSGVAQALPDQHSVDRTVDDILVSYRQGRNLPGYDDLYADSEVKNILQVGNDTIARSYIQDKLCSLGLMNCENLEGRRPYYAPHRDIHPQEVIYAQPVTIKPVGRPLPAIPVRKPVGYGPPKPVPVPPGFGSGPFHSGPPGHGFSGPPPSFSGPVSSYPGPYQSYKKPPHFINNKPIYEDTGLDGEYDFIPENKHDFLEKKQVLPPTAGIQQHVHHHYHHGDDKTASVITGTPGLAGPILGPGPIGGNYGYGNGGTYGQQYNDFDEYKKTFKIKETPGGNSLDPIESTSSYANKYPIYEKPKRDSFFNGKGFGSSEGTGKVLTGGFGSNGFSGFNGDNGFSSSNYDDCVCVPYDQCAAIDHAGRKDDLFLPIDPRNTGKNIDAEAEDIVVTDANGGMSVVRVPKGVNATEQADQKKESDDKKNDGGKRQKREAKAEAKSGGPTDKAALAQSRLLGNIDSSKLNVKPTWGVSFGLPQGGGGYPVNPYGENPLQSPYGGYGSGGNGLNLGLVSVNPLVALQVGKDDYGEKVIKPFVNLHVTPNQGIVNKFTDLLAHKKQQLLGGYGQYPGYPGYGHYAPHHHGPHYERPQQHFHQHQHQHQYQRPGWLGTTGNYGGNYGGNYYSNYPENYGNYPGNYAGHHGQYHGYNGYNRNDEDYDYSDLSDYSDYARSRKFNGTGARGQSGNDQDRGSKVAFRDRKRRDVGEVNVQERQFGRPPVCGPRHVCCRRNQLHPGSLNRPKSGQCGVRNGQGVNGRIKTPVYIDGDSEFGEYPWQVAILKKDPSESVYVCGGTLISPRHILTAAHCVKTHSSHDLRARLGEWDVNHDVEFYPYIERDIVNVFVHPEFYAGTLYNDIAILKLDHDVDFERNPHISPACLPDKFDEFAGTRCWTTGWGKDAFGDFGKYQNILKEVDVPVISNQVCENQMRRTRLGPTFNLHPGFVCAGGEDGKDACKGDGGGPMVCERHGVWQLAGVVSWGIGCGQPGVPGVYARVSHYLDWIRQVTGQY